MDELPFLVPLLASLLGGAIPAISALLARRSAQPSEAELAVTQGELELALAAAMEGRPTVEPESPPTSKGKDEALLLMSTYMRDLTTEAGRIAKRFGAEGASDVHVREAAARIGILRSRAGVIADLSLALGSLLLGVALSYQVNVWTGGTPSERAGVYAALSLSLGVGLFVWAATMKLRQR